MAFKRGLHAVPPGGGPTRRKSARVLIADDDRDNADTLAALMQGEGHEAMVALRGDDALKMCRLFRPDVVITDVNLPGASGYAIARELRERHGNLAPMLVAMTGVWTQESDRLLAQAVGFDHYLVKPYDLERLLAAVRSFLAQSPGTGSVSGTGELT